MISLGRWTIEFLFLDLEIYRWSSSARAWCHHHQYKIRTGKIRI